jgi:AAA domain-containing protein
MNLQPNDKRLNLVSLSSVRSLPVSFVIPPFVPRGKVTLLIGDPGDGKTYIALDFSAKVTRGTRLQTTIPVEGELVPTGPTGTVLYFSGEDGLADTIKHRLGLLGADERMFFAFDGVVEHSADGDRRSRFLLTDPTPLKRAIEEHYPDLVVIDPLQSFLGGRVDMHRANEMRAALEGITELAEQYNLAVLILCHLNKSSQAQAMYRTLGSIDIAAIARSILLVGPHPNKKSYALVHLKCSLGPKGPTMLYRIDDSGLHWEGPDDLSADELLGGTERPTAKKNAVEMLKSFLAAGPKPSQEVFDFAVENGLTRGSMRSAAESLGVEMKPSSFRGQWMWTLSTADGKAQEPSTENQEAPISI